MTKRKTTDVELPVMFRASTEDGQRWITAVFPTEAASVTDWNLFTIYEHVGQHGAGSMGWYLQTRPAHATEYADLLAELRGIYETPKDGDPVVRLRVVRRFQSAYHRQRQASLAKATA